MSNCSVIGQQDREWPPAPFNLPNNPSQCWANRLLLASVEYCQQERSISPALRCFQWNRSLHSWSSDASAPALTLCPFPAFGRPVRTELGAPNSRASRALFLPPGIRPPRDPHRIPPVVPLIEH